MRTSWLAAVLVLLAAAPSLAAPSNQPEARRRVRRVDLVLALDASSSMSGLIDSARQKMWDVVGLLGKAQPRPELRVGLISYGHSSYKKESGWVRVDSDLTSDLDSVYGRLFGITTGGGDEYVARAIQTATQQMHWSQDDDALRIVFVAGNESATQDPRVSIESAIADAREHRIYVNAIYCGSAAARDAIGWTQVAALGKGQYAAINHNRTVAIAAPQDAELRRLSEELNQTYVAYGADGARGQANQIAQDKNAESASGAAAASRAAGKASGLYTADNWDLVDATRSKKKDAAAMPAEELPAELRSMSAGERARFLAHKGAKRAEIQGRIRQLNEQREHHVAAEKAKGAPTTKPGAPAAAAMDDALLGGIKTEAQASGFSF